MVTAIHDEGHSLILGECHMTTLNSNPLHFGLVETNTTVTFLECSCGGSFDAALVKEIPSSVGLIHFFQFLYVMSKMECGSCLC